MHGAGDTQLAHGTAAVEREVPPDRLAELHGIGSYVAHIVGDLIGLAETLAEQAPRLGVSAGGRGTGGGRRREQGAGLGPMVLG